MDLYFVRHGQTEWNREMRFQGRAGDSPLLPESYLEIATLGKYLRTFGFARVYTSPLKRAFQTASGIVAEWSHPVKIVETANLKELGLGELEGKKIEQAREQYGEQLDALRSAPDRYDPSAFKGEKYLEMLKRSTNVVLEAVTANQTEQPLLFVGHGAALTGCIQTLAGQPLSSVRKMGGLENNSVSILQTEGSSNPPFTLRLWNDRSYLDKSQ